MYLEDVTWCQPKWTLPDHGGALPDPGEKMTVFFVTSSEPDPQQALKAPAPLNITGSPIKVRELGAIRVCLHTAGLQSLWQCWFGP